MRSADGKPFHSCLGVLWRLHLVIGQLVSMDDTCILGILDLLVSLSPGCMGTLGAPLEKVPGCSWDHREGEF